MQKLKVNIGNEKPIEVIRPAYPYKVFETKEGNTYSEEDQKSRDYVKRFLDVTKADLFFAKNIILVEELQNN